MFRSEPMMMMQTVVLAQDERAVFKGLGRLGAVHLTRTPSGPDTAPLGPVDRTDEQMRYDLIRIRVQELRRSLGIPSFPGGPPVSAEMTLDQAEEGLRSLEQGSSHLLGQRHRLMQRKKELSDIFEKVSNYRGLKIPLAGLDKFSFLHFATGSLPVQNLEDLGKEVGDNVALLPITEHGGQQSLCAITTRNGRIALEKALQKAGFQNEILPEVSDANVDGLTEENLKEQELLSVELEQLQEKVKVIAAEFTVPLNEIEGFVDMECQLLEASQKFPRTESTILISGWVPKSELVTLEKRMDEITAGRYNLRTTLPDTSLQDEVPVLLKHHRLLRPFEMLISNYSLPSYRELEPTLFFAISYLVMFGMMFGDGGHGLVLTVCGLVAIFAGRSRKMSDIGVLLVLGGSSSIIFGVIYGSYFGIESFKKYAIWHDPLDADPIHLMYAAMGIGIALMSTGLILNVINRFRRGDVVGGILDKFGLVGILFYWGMLVLLINWDAIRSHGLVDVAVIAFLIIPVVGWCLKEPIEHFMAKKGHNNDHSEVGLSGAIIESCVGAFEAILSYLANTISFVRLAAYAMSHAALIFAAFVLAAQVRDFSFGGSFLSLLVIILGNLIAIVLEGVIVSVQALRLEYYEFFGKFFSGGGKPFEPFRLAREDEESVS